MSTRTTPSGLSNVAPTGQTCVHGESTQWLHIFGTKNDFMPSPGVVDRGNPSYPPFGRVDERVIGIVGVDPVPLDPRAEAPVVERDVVLVFARAHAVARADAQVDVDGHPHQ